MKRHVHLDAVGGVAGDMFVAALLDAVPELEPRVMADLDAVKPPRAGRPVLEEGASCGLAVRRFRAVPTGEAAPPADRNHGTRYVEVVRSISAATLQPGTREHALAILERVARAESRVHRVALEDVHFHEVADWDSLMDVVAAGSIAAALAPCSWSVSDLPLGGGQVVTRHGRLPVPAPATADLLRGFRWRDDGVGGERVTPTGAAVVAHLARVDGPPPGGVLRGIGLGAGTRELPGMPNVLRALVFEADEVGAESARREDVVVVAFDVDDMTGEELGVAADRLRAADGVIDLSLGSRFGKKGRPSTEVRLLVRPDAVDAVCRLCFAETSTIGLRWRREQRLCLPRTVDGVVRDGVTLARKHSVRPDGGVRTKVESDRLADTAGLDERRRLKARGEQGDADP